ncbi:MAG: arylsulfatase [Sediminibacterium sp.]|jgi:arylsulfatase A-like enzyme
MTSIIIQSPFTIKVNYKIYVAFCIFFLLCIFSLSVHAQTKPNVIYIYADDLGYGELGSYGQQKIRTPNLDKLAKEGIRFTQHYTSAPVCAPARCMLLTGRHSGHTYIHGNYELGEFADSLEGGQMPLAEGTFTIGHLMQNAGYKTAIIGKWGLGMANTTGSPQQQGFDYAYGYLDQKQAHNYYPTHLWENGRWDTLNNAVISVHKKLDSLTATDKDFEYYNGKDYAPAKLTEKALSFIERNSKEPFFLYLPYTLPHLSLQAPALYVKKYMGQFEERPYFGQQGYASTKYPLSTYAAMITYLDDQVGIILDKIKKLGLDNNTIILFSSDNGASFDAGGINRSFFNSNGGLRGVKAELFEGGIREPFIARWPNKIKAGSTSELISIQFDFMATLAELTQQKIAETDGISFLPTLIGNNQEQKKHDFLYFEFPEKGGQIAIRMGDWKGVKVDIRLHPEKKWMLFNLANDRNETIDIAQAHPELISKFEAIVKKEHRNSHIKEWEFINPKFISVTH